MEIVSEYARNKVVVIVKANALKSPSRIIDSCNMYRRVKDLYYFNGVIDIIPKVMREMKPKTFAVASSLVHYWIIFPGKIDKYFLDAPQGIREATRIGKTFGVEEKDVEELVKMIPKIKKLVR